jgi:hypothetical protein
VTGASAAPEITPQRAPRLRYFIVGLIFLILGIFDAGYLYLWWQSGIHAKAIAGTWQRQDDPTRTITFEPNGFFKSKAGIHNWSIFGSWVRIIDNEPVVIERLRLTHVSQDRLEFDVLRSGSLINLYITTLRLPNLTRIDGKRVYERVKE